jgi:3-oxoacyl-(acyl-carrier-protein) synthase
LSGASGRGSITAEERAFLEDFGNTGKIAVRGTAAAFGHTLECAFLLNLALAVSVLEARSLFPPLDAAEPLETPLVGTPRQILVTSWGHARGVGTALVEAIDGKA